MRNKVLLIFALIIAVFIIASLMFGYWETVPYASYKTGEEITGFPFEGTSMTVNGLSTAPDITFPQSSTDIFVNVTVHKLVGNSQQSQFPEALSKHLSLSYQTGAGHGEISAWNDSNLFGIVTSNNELNSLTANQSVDGSIRFVFGNGDYTSFQLVCRVESQQKPLFIVDLHTP